MASKPRRINLQDLVTLAQGAMRMGLEQSTLYQARGRDGSGFPAPVWSGGRIALYDYEELRAWRETKGIVRNG